MKKIVPLLLMALLWGCAREEAPLPPSEEPVMVTIAQEPMVPLAEALAEEKLLEEAVRRCAVACYAAEGFYPSNIDYLQAHYGLQYDEESYIIHYQSEASNLMPDITVLERK